MSDLMFGDRLPSSATLVDVGLRDGLQSVVDVVETDHKLAILDALVAAGFTTIEITSFAHPKVLPQFGDAEEVIARAPRHDGVTYKALVPNLRGAQRASETAIDELVMVIPVDEATAAKNQNSSPTRLLDEFAEAVDLAHRAGKKVTAAIATAFFAPCRGVMDSAEMTGVVKRAADAGADSLYLAGTSGMETPSEFDAGLRTCKQMFPDLPIGVHLHNRNGFGLVNALASLEAGADWIEGSFGGLGGDLWFPGDDSVLGNAPMEDIVNLLHSLGVQTGIDFDKYREVVRRGVEYTGVPSYSFVSRGGTREDLAHAEWPA